MDHRYIQDSMYTEVSDFARDIPRFVRMLQDTDLYISG